MGAGILNFLNLFQETSGVKKSKRPPGPGGLPFLGSMLKAKENPLRFSLDLVGEYGDIVQFKIGFYTGYLLNHPDYVQHVLNVNQRNYSKDNYNYRKLKPVLGNGLITADGEHWRRERSLIQPVFQRNHITEFGNKIIKSTNKMLDRWEAQTVNGNTLDISAEMMKLTLRIISQSLFGTDLGTSVQTVEKAFNTLNEDIAYRFKHVYVAPHWVPTPRNRAFREARDELNRIVLEIIEKRRNDTLARNDLLDTLLSARADYSGEKEITDQQIRDEVMTLMLAGHETTANLLTWACYLVSQHPGVEDKLMEELDAVCGNRTPGVEDIRALKYTEMVLQETMRLYPPVWIISRKAVNKDEVGNYTIPAGTTVTICLYTLHRHPDNWESPVEFNPGHFSTKRVRNRHKYAYIPFGGGPRSCIGKYFAMMEAQLILAMILRRYKLTLATDLPVEPEPLVTLRPRNGLKMMVEPRSN